MIPLEFRKVAVLVAVTRMRKANLTTERSNVAREVSSFTNEDANVALSNISDLMWLECLDVHADENSAGLHLTLKGERQLEQSLAAYQELISN